jgi:hypothetical protein
MSLPLLTKQEFSFFSAQFQLTYIDRHGKLIFFKILRGNLSVSVYSVSEFKIRVLKSFPKGELIEISILVHESNTTKYFGLMYRN